MLLKEHCPAQRTKFRFAYFHVILPNVKIYDKTIKRIHDELS